MSHPLFFRGVTYFYPIGNTSAVRLTEHIPPEQQANILLLACGDPRHILYTVYTSETNSNIGAGLTSSYLPVVLTLFTQSRRNWM